MTPASRDRAALRRALAGAFLFVGLAAVNSVAYASSSDTYTVTPCRVVDTRGPAGPSGGPALVGNSSRDFTVAGVCGIPSGTVGVWLVVTVVNQTSDGYLTIYPSDVTRPIVASLNFKPADKVISNLVFVALDGGGNGTLTAYDLLASGSDHVDVVMDVTAYVK